MAVRLGFGVNGSVVTAKAASRKKGSMCLIGSSERGGVKAALPVQVKVLEVELSRLEREKLPEASYEATCTDMSE